MEFFLVPKFIEKETKFFGPLTMRQSFILGIGLGIITIFHFFAKKYFWWAIFIVAPICFIISFVQIEGFYITTFLANLFQFYFRKKTYTYGKKVGPLQLKERVYVKKETPKIPLKTESYLGQLKSRVEIKEYARK